MELDDSRMYFFVYQLYLNADILKIFTTCEGIHVYLSFLVVVSTSNNNSNNQMFLRFYLVQRLPKRQQISLNVPYFVTDTLIKLFIS